MERDPEPERQVTDATTDEAVEPRRVVGVDDDAPDPVVAATVKSPRPDGLFVAVVVGVMLLLALCAALTLLAANRAPG